MKNIIIIILLIILIVAMFDYDQTKLLFYAVQPFSKNYSQSNFSLNTFKIGIITAEDRNDEYIKYHDISFQKYCDLHNYDYIRTTNCSKEESTTYWCKIHKVKTALDSGKYDYVMWADSDTIITNLNISLGTIIKETGEPDIIIGKDTWFTSIINIICAGIFLIKNSKEGKSFIDECLSKINNKPQCIYNNKEQGIWAGICYEQGVMNLLIREKYKNAYIDTENKYFFNCTPTSNCEDFKTVFLHLAGWGNESRANIFKKYLS